MQQVRTHFSTAYELPLLARPENYAQVQHDRLHKKKVLDSFRLYLYEIELTRLIVERSSSCESKRSNIYIEFRNKHQFTYHTNELNIE